MRKWALFIVTLLITISLCAQKKNKIVEKGVKSITEIKEDYENSNGKTTFESYIVYDRSGNIVEERNYNKAGKETERIVSEYDKDNQKVKETHYNPSGQVTFYEEHKYLNGLKIEKNTYYSNGKLKMKKKYGYSFYDK
jgi:hypothetical protein